MDCGQTPNTRLVTASQVIGRGSANYELSMPSGSPRDYLVRPDEFGRNPDALFKPWDESRWRARALVARAHQQHRLAQEVVAELRLQRMTQTQLAESIGSRPGTVSKQLNGDDWMPIEDVYAMAGALGHIDWLPTPSDFSELLPRRSES